MHPTLDINGSNSIADFRSFLPDLECKSSLVIVIVAVQSLLRIENKICLDVNYKIIIITHYHHYHDCRTESSKRGQETTERAHFGMKETLSTTAYDSFSDVGENRVYFASKILTPCRMH